MHFGVTGEEGWGGGWTLYLYKNFLLGDISKIFQNLRLNLGSLKRGIKKPKWLNILFKMKNAPAFVSFFLVFGLDNFKYILRKTVNTLVYKV